MKWWFRQPLYRQILVGIVIGIALGYVLGPKAEILKPIGDIFIRLLMMLIVPLTFFTLISGITKLESLSSFRTLGGLIVLYYVLSSVFASTLGMTTALLIKPGKEGAGLLQSGEEVQAADFNFWDNLVSWFPRNPVEALAQGNMLQIIIFSLIVGIGLIALGKRGRHLILLINEGADLMIVVTEFVMKTAPYGILALVANMVASLGSEMLTEVFRLILADYSAQILILLIFYPLVLRFLARLNPWRFYGNVFPAMLVAASTTSSGATLPVSMAVAEDNLGVSKRVWGFSLPLGATVNMDGMAAAIGVIGIFAANLYGVAITPALILQIVFLGLALSIGTAGIKGGGIIMSGILLQSLNMPLTLIPILASLWPILDIGHTTSNVTGDLIGTSLVGSRLKLMEKAIFDKKVSTKS
jgi:Na+/H+-dicarboxylate symporter